MLSYEQTGEMIPLGPSKLYGSFEAVDEINLLRDYVAALSAYDIVAGRPLHICAAFDLLHWDPLQRLRGLVDWDSFLYTSLGSLPELPELPISWGSITTDVIAQMSFVPDTLSSQTLANGTDYALGDMVLVGNSLFEIAGLSSMPPTLWLNTTLPGGAPKPVKRQCAAAGSLRKRPATASTSSATGSNSAFIAVDCPDSRCAYIDEHGTQCLVPPQTGQAFVIGGRRYCKRHASVIRELPQISSPRTCPFVDVSVTPALVCTRTTQRTPAYFYKGTYFCKRHAAFQKGKDCRAALRSQRFNRRVLRKTTFPALVPGKCPYVNNSMTPAEACTRQAQRTSASLYKGTHFCNRHASLLQGRGCRSKELPLDLQIRPRLGPRMRLRAKQPRPKEYVLKQSRPKCQWSVECQEHGRQQKSSLWYCKSHARRVCIATAAVLALADYKDDLVPTHHCGSMDDVCEHCGSRNFALERVGKPPHFNLCCEGGKAMNIPPVKPPPPALRELLTLNSRVEKRFRERINDYNTAFSFVSFGFGKFPLVHGGRGPPIIQCHGIAYHMAGELFPDDPNNAKYAQVYMYDPDVSLARRKQLHKDLDPKVLAILQDMMDEFSGYVQDYRDMRTVLQENEAPTVTLGFVSPENADMRRYNHPQTREPACVFVGQDGAPQTNRDIVIWPKGETSVHRVSELNEHVDPLSYPLLFPLGDLGWTPQLRHDEKYQTKSYQRLTSMQFYSHRLMRRDPECLLPHAGGLLFQQYVCETCTAKQKLRGSRG